MVRLKPEVKATLHAHAHVLNVKDAEIIRDILEWWCATATNWEHPYFSEETLGFGPITGPERYPGYGRALGFRYVGHEVVGEEELEINEQEESEIIPDRGELERLMRKHHA
jgi:hypothetical protein